MSRRNNRQTRRVQDFVGFNPAVSFGPVIVLLSDVGVTQAAGTATAWADQSGHANHFNGGSTAYTASGIHGLPSLGSKVSNANSLTSAKNGNVMIPAGSAELFLVLQGVSASGTVLWQGLGNSGQIVYFPFTDDHIYPDFNSTSRPAVTTDIHTNPVMVNIISTSAEFTVNVSGTQVFTTATNTTGMPASTVFLVGSNGSGWTGWLSALLAYPQKLATAQRATVHAWAQGKYGVA